MMKKKYRKNWFNKSMLVFLAVLIVGTSLAGLAMARGENELFNSDVEEVEELSNNGETLDSLKHPEEIQSPKINSVISSKSVVDDMDKRIEQIKEKSIELKNNRLRNEDTFNYTKVDIEKLILAGATVEDIYMSDQIANEWLISPEELMELKAQTSASWENISIAIQQEKEKKLQELFELYPTAGEKFSTVNMNTAEKVEVLETLKEKNISKVTQDNLEEAIDSVSNNENIHNHVYSISDLNIQEELSQ